MKKMARIENMAECLKEAKLAEIEQGRRVKKWIDMIGVKADLNEELKHKSRTPNSGSSTVE